MAKINLPIHKVKLAELVKSSPDGRIDKLFLQCEIKAINGGDAEFNVIAYVGDKVEQKWKVGKRVPCTASEVKSFELSKPIGFANIEVRLRYGKKKHKLEGDHKNKSDDYNKQTALLELINRIDSDKNLFAEAELTFTPKITDNPHIGFDVTLGVGGRQIQLLANPSPPAPPEEDILF